MVNNQTVKDLLNRGFRNPCHLKVILGLTDPAAEESKTVSATGGTYYSDVTKATENAVITNQYATLEDYFTPLDGVKELPREVDDEQLYQGYVSEVMSDGDSLYDASTAPQVIIEFDTGVRLTALTFGFDTINDEYPTELNLKTYLADSLVEDLTVNPDNSTYSFVHLFEEHDKVILTWVSSSRPYRRARFSSLAFGVKMTYDTSDRSEKSNIIDATETRELSLVNKTLPTFDFKFSVNNIEGTYDIDNPTGLTYYLLENQNVTYEWGIENDDGEVQWVLGGTMLTKGEITADYTKITIPCMDKLGILDETYKKAVYSSTAKTLYELAVEVLTDAGVDSEDYILDDSLQNITTTAPLPDTTHKACLQIIASAGECLLYSDRNGKICIKKHNNTNTGETLDFHSIMKEPPKTAIVQKLKDLSTYYYTYKPNSSSGEIASLETTLNGTETLELSYGLSVEQSATITGGTINSAEYYGRYCMLNVTAEGDITITVTGKELVETSTIVKKEYHSTGNSGESTNPLLTTYERSLAYLDFLANTIENRYTYDATFRGNPLIDVGDVVNAQTKFAEDVPSTVTKTIINYNGSFDGNIKFVKQNTI